MAVHQARRLRRAMSAPEVTLWTYLRTKPDGLKFRRQHPLGPFVFDFFCASAALAIEVDGMAHEMGDNPRRDELRNRWAADRGIKVMRFRADDVQTQLEDVCTLILQECSLRTPPPPPAVPLPAESRGGKP